MGAAAAILALAVAAWPADASGGEPRVECHTDPAAPGFGTFAVAGLLAPLVASLRSAGRDDLAAALVVRTTDAEPDWPALLGEHEIENDRLRFTPRFAPVPGMAYRVAFRHAEVAVDGECRFPEAGAMPATRVTAVFPSGDSVPENLLRLYVHFDAPMRPDDVHEHVRLLDAAGAAVPLPFVEIPEGLWDPSGHRLTLFVHPGRVKRGVAPNRELGPVLREGETYRLVVDAGLRDAGGERLGESFERTLRVEAADRRSPDPARWRFEAPTSPDAPVVLAFDEPLDRALLERYVTVSDARGARVEGTLDVAAGERRWTFTPRAPWLTERYVLRVDPRLEDRAGNRIHRLFDEHVARDGPPGEGESAEPVVLPFAVGRPQLTP